MCVVSMVMEHYHEKWTQPPYWPGGTAPYEAPIVVPKDWQIELDKLTKPPVVAPTAEEIEEFRKLLERAREYDRKNNEPDCELDEKRQALKQLAKAMGIEIAFL